MARYLVTGGTGNWNSTTNWSTTSGGLSGASFPVSTDDVIIDALSLNALLIINVASACLSITIANAHTGTLRVNQTLTVSGNVTLGSGMTITTTTGTPTLAVIAASTLTSNGKTWPYAINLSTAGNKTFADAWTVGGTFTSTTTSSTNVLSANLTCNGNITMSNAQTWNGNTIISNASLGVNQAVAGTTLFSIRGSGWSGSGLINNLEINSANTVTIAGTVAASTLTYVTAAAVVTTSSTLSCSNANATWNTAGIVWNNITLGAGTITLNSLLTATGTMTVAASNTVTFAGTAGFNVNTYIQTVGRITTFVAGKTYTITTQMTCTGTAAATVRFVSSTPTSSYALTLTNGLIQANVYLDVTDADSSLGATGWTVLGTLLRTVNWNNTPLQPITLTYSN